MLFRSLLATFDEYLQLRDLYFPFIGEEDHTTYDHKHRVGFFVEGRGFSWLDDGNWDALPQYAADTLVGTSRLINRKLGISIEAGDFVHPVKDILMRHFLIRAIEDEEIHLKIYFNHDLHIYGEKQKDTAFYEPSTNSVIHYRKKRHFLIGGKAGGQGITSYTTGKSEFRELEGTWRDAEDGHLSRHTIEQGSVDSTVELQCTACQTCEEHVWLWLCASKTMRDPDPSDRDYNPLKQPLLYLTFQGSSQ